MSGSKGVAAVTLPVMFFYLLFPKEEDCVIKYVVFVHRGVR